jgi:hypothetical protein
MAKGLPEGLSIMSSLAQNEGTHEPTFVSRKLPRYWGQDPVELRPGHSCTHVSWLPTRPDVYNYLTSRVKL